MNAQRMLRQMEERSFRGPLMMGVKRFGQEGLSGVRPKEGPSEVLDRAGKDRDTRKVGEVCAYLVRSSADAPLEQVARWSDMLRQKVKTARSSWNASVLAMVESASEQVDAAYQERAMASDATKDDGRPARTKEEQETLDKELRKAAERGDLPEVKRLVREGADPSAVDEKYPHKNAVSAAMGDDVYDTLPVVDAKHQEVVDYLAPLVRAKHKQSAPA